jgi:hypothetical protein
MKFLKVIFASVVALSFHSAYAFHSGGVADCDGCHTMHNSFENKAVAVHPGNEGDINQVTNVDPGASTQFQGKNFLLQGSDTSSTCLNCHAGSALSSFEVMTYPFPGAGIAPVQRTPGGDFAWLTKTYSGNRGATIYGERHGHNVVAADFGLVADTTQTVAPGGTYPASNLSCASCHDPHSRARIIDANGDIASAQLGQNVLPIYTSGSYGSAPTATAAIGVYRLLGSATYTQMSLPGEVPFASNPPVAVAPATYNQTEATQEVRVAYGAGMSEWCANCHVSIHNGNTGAPSIGGANTALIHPAGNTALLTAAANNLNGNATGTTIAAIYNAYVMSGNLTGVQTSSYTSMVPFERGTTVIATLAALSSNANSAGSGAGPSTGTENVMCLSCHRAHATGFESMTRWDNTSNFITTAGAFQTGIGLSAAEYQAAMYDRNPTVYATYQRSLCNKCHAKD